MSEAEHPLELRVAVVAGPVDARHPRAVRLALQVRRFAHRHRLHDESHWIRLTTPRSRWIITVSPVASWLLGNAMVLSCNAHP